MADVSWLPLAMVLPSRLNATDNTFYPRDLYHARTQQTSQDWNDKYKFGGRVLAAFKTWVQRRYMNGRGHELARIARS
jgi:hypothetical protein